MKKKLYILLLLFIACFIVGVGYYKIVHQNNENYSNYEGENLVIAVIGELPSVNNQFVSFSQVSFDDIDDGNIADYDAIFIMKDMLIEASRPQYANIYMSLRLPFFFIGTKKSFIPFVDKNLSYEEAITVHDQSYCTGIFYQTDDMRNIWKYGLYNDKYTKDSIEDMYNRIFDTVSETLLKR